uniref:Uncharacterized protein n=1 Tax=Rhodosorus marinus TaxID=101924 RepID=A0A7S3E7S5_9RHOD|mmetsp:Transcript_12360/g.50742  ORF Transcript_12360/g.50742 Transcript_12360/m.50742 type:complete len:105 (+) Transcript_12360:112-426(+)
MNSSTSPSTNRSLDVSFAVTYNHLYFPRRQGPNAESASSKEPEMRPTLIHVDASKSVCFQVNFEKELSLTERTDVFQSQKLPSARFGYLLRWKTATNVYAKIRL